MKKIALLLILLLFSFNIYAIDWCGAKNLRSEDEAQLCRDKKKFELLKKKDALAAKQRKHGQDVAEANKPPAPKNVGAQSGNTGTFINLGGLLGSRSGTESESVSKHGIPLSKHNLTLEWHLYRFPKMDELDRQMPDQWLIPRSFRYDWRFSRNFGFGLIYELYKLKSTRQFDPITSNQDIRETVEIINSDGTTGTATREVNRDVPYLFPGAIKSVEYENLWYFVSFGGSLGMNSDWNALIRFGSALISNATIEYNDVDLSLDENEYAEQPNDRDVSSSQPMFLDFAVERQFEGSSLSAFIRFTESDNDTTSRLDFVPMGGVTVGLALSTGFPSLGYL